MSGDEGDAHVVAHDTDAPSSQAATGAPDGMLHLDKSQGADDVAVSDSTSTPQPHKSMDTERTREASNEATTQVATTSAVDDDLVNKSDAFHPRASSDLSVNHQDEQGLASEETPISVPAGKQNGVDADGGAIARSRNATTQIGGDMKDVDQEADTESHSEAGHPTFIPETTGFEDPLRTPSAPSRDSDSDPDPHEHAVSPTVEVGAGDTRPQAIGSQDGTSLLPTDQAPSAILLDPLAPSTSHPGSSAASSSPVAHEDSRPTTIYGVVLVGFNHTLGPVVDWSYPSHLKTDEDIVKNLPFLALPDGAHLRDEDYSCFHLYLPNISPATIYGISCIRQLRADELVNRTADITRSTVQKGVVVLANKPVFGPIRDKLGVITRAFFAQRDFENTEILEHFYKSLEHALKDDDQTSENAIYMGMSLRELVWKFRLQTLVMLKLLLLQKKIMLWGTQTERLCSFQYSLVSLVPLLLLHLEDAASPVLNSREAQAEKPSSLRTSDRKSLLSYIGLPLNLFGKDAFFQPYLPLQQLEMLKAKSYLVGTTNSIFQSQKDCQIDVIINIETAAIEFRDPKLASLVNLTAADRKWMDEIVKVVDASWNPSDPHRPTDMGFKGSDDWLRSRFEEYVCSALAAIKFVDYLSKAKDAAVLINTSDPTGLASFNESWLAAFRQTHAFMVWDRNTDPVIFDLVEPRHPCEGQAHLLEDVGIRLANGLHDLHLEERLGPTQEAISKGLATGSEGVWRVYSSLRADIAKRQAEYKDRKEREQKERDARLTGEKEEPAGADPAREQDIANQVLAGAAEVGGKAASFASNFGSFLGSKIAKQRTQMFSAPSLSSGAAASVARPEGEVAGEPPSSRTSSDDPTTAATSTPAEAQNVKTSRPAFFSAFRGTSSPTTEASATEMGKKEPQSSSTPPTSSTPQPALSPSASLSSFGSFFRRTSTAPSLPSFLPTFGQADTSSETRQPQRHEARPATYDGDVLEGYEDVAGLIKDLDKQRDDPLGSNTSASVEMGSNRSSVDMMSDVRL